MNTSANQCRKILIICPSRLGDMVMYTAAIKQLKDHYPNLIIDVIAFSKICMQVLRYNPAINHSFLVTDHDLKDIYHHYDGVYDLYASKKSLIYAEGFQVNKLERAGFAPELALNRACIVAAFLATQFHYTAKEINKYYIYPQQSHVSLVNDLLRSVAVNDKEDILIGIHLGSSRVENTANKMRQWVNIYLNSLVSRGLKSWSIKKYIKLAKKITRDYPRAKIILTGTTNEKGMGEFFARKIPGTINLMGKTDVQSLLVLLSKLKLYITNDSGPLHIACATDVPVIALFRGKAKKYHPIKSAKRVVIQKETHHHISVAEVYHQVWQLLQH